MKLAIVAYPSLDDGDRLWIESFRSKHDPQASRIGVHFTLVFPFEGLPGEFEAEITAVAQSTRPISFAIRRTTVVRDGPGDGSRIFLVPDEGRTHIAALHDRLYAGGLRVHLRSDMPFVPHMTVGAAPDSQSAQALTEELAGRSRILRGTVDNIDVIDVGAPRVRAIAAYALGSGASGSG